MEPHTQYSLCSLTYQGSPVSEPVMGLVGTRSDMLGYILDGLRESSNSPVVHRSYNRGRECEGFTRELNWEIVEKRWERGEVLEMS